MKELKKDAIWNILNNFRMKYFFSGVTAEISLTDFDDMLSKVKEELNSQ